MLSMIPTVSDWLSIITRHRELGDRALASHLMALGRKDAREFLLSRPLRCATSATQWAAEELAAQGTQLLAVTDSQYPRAIRALLGAGAPPLLYLRGNPHLLSREGIAIIGTRRPSKHGLTAATTYGAAIAAAGLAVVSGNAPGIDACAHEASLDAGGVTIVFAPQCAATVQPRFAGWDSTRCVLASPFVPGNAPPDRWQFLARNALVAAFSGAALIAETGSRGGTLNTVGHLRRLGCHWFVTKLPDDARHCRAHESLAASGGRRIPVKCSRRALEMLLKVARGGRILIPEQHQDSLFRGQEAGQ